MYPKVFLFLLVFLIVGPVSAGSSGYVFDSNGVPVYNANVTVYNGTYGARDYSDLNGYWNLNIYADGEYNYRVAKLGYAVNSSTKVFMMGGTNYNFTLTPIQGRIYGTVFTYVDLTAPQPIELDLVALKGQMDEATVGMGGTQTLGKLNGLTYVLQFKDVDCGGRQVSVTVLESGTGLYVNQIISEKGKAEWLVYEDTTVQTYITVSVGAIQCGREINFVKLKSSFDTRKKTWVTMYDFVNWIFQRSLQGDFGKALAIIDLFNWLDFGPSKSSSSGVVFNSSSQSSVIAQAVADFNRSIETTSFQVILNAESLSNLAGKIGLGYTDDDIEFNDYYNEYYINNQNNPKNQGFDVVDFKSVDSNGNKKIKIWLKLYSGYSSVKLYNFYLDPYGPAGTSSYLPGATVYYNSTVSTQSGSPNGYYTLAVPFGTNLIKFFKDGFENKNVTRVFNGTQPEYQYDVWLNATNLTRNFTDHYVYVKPDPVVIGGPQGYIYYKTGDHYWYKVAVCQLGNPDNCYSADDLLGDLESRHLLGSFEIGPYSVYLTAVKSILWPFREIVAANNFTVRSSEPSLRWGSSQY